MENVWSLAGAFCGICLITRLMVEVIAYAQYYADLDFKIGIDTGSIAQQTSKHIFILKSFVLGELSYMRLKDRFPANST